MRGDGDAGQGRWRPGWPESSPGRCSGGAFRPALPTPPPSWNRPTRNATRRVIVLAFVLNETGPALQTDRPSPAVPAGFVRVKLRVAGICNTDLELAKGYMGFEGVLGHEFVGEALDGPLAGQRVVGGINFGCGDCPRCEAGMARHCANRTVLGILGADGVFAEEFVMPEGNLIPVPDNVSDEAAVFTEPAAAACEILEQLPDLPPCPALVMGDGKLGLLIAQVLQAHGFRVDLVGRHLDSLAWMDEQGVRRVGEAPDRGDYSLVVEATGSAAGLETALASTAPRGTLILKTTVAGNHQVNLAPAVIDEIRILGSRCGRFEPALELLAGGSIQTEPLIEARYPLADMDNAFAHAQRRGSRKVLVLNEG